MIPSEGPSLSRIDMKIFHFIAVTSVEVQPHELPRVQYADYILQADSAESAWDEIKDHKHAAEAADVWVHEFTTPLRITPLSTFNHQEPLSQYRHWSRVQESYRLLPRTTETIYEQQDKLLESLLLQATASERRLAVHNGGRA